ncbi:MAG: acetate--CoA ligase [Solirubrobacteraceae bacterium]|nr:MAG: acetate--CoA ligase [Solirubrobacterales bacterium]
MTDGTANETRDSGAASEDGSAIEGLESDLARELEQQSEIESFDPPEQFKAAAIWSDPSVYEEAERDPLAWWECQAEALDWAQRWETVLDDSNPPFYKWFLGGRLNASYNCLDRHVEAGRGDRVAYHWRGEGGEERDVTYAELHCDVQKLANVLKDRGISAGDVVGIYLPMIPEVVVAMLACARIGAPHNVVFGGFSPESVKERMEFSEAKALITVNRARRKGKAAPIKEPIDDLIGDVPSVETIIVIRNTDDDAPMTEGRDIWYHEAIASVDDECPAEPLDAEHPLFILYTSGSTAKPKGILHTTGGYLTGAAYTTKHVFDVKPDSDTYWCAADVGWVTGHSYIVYGPLLNGLTSVMWEGGPDYPSKDIWWEIAERYKATILYTAPTAIRAFMKWGADLPGKHDLSSLRLLGSVGEPINPKAWLWYRKVIGGERCPIVDTWWQTETGHIMISPLPGITSTKPGSAMRPLPGIAAEVVDERDGKPIEEGQGLLVLTRPWPGMLRTLYREEERFKETYFERFGSETYLVGDAARLDKDGDFWVIGRIDDVINVSGHRMSTAEIESAIVSHPRVAEAAAIGQNDEDTGQAVCAFVTLEGATSDGGDELMTEIREHVGTRIGKFARPKRLVWAADLPKTRSGKIMRRLLRDIAEGREVGDVTTLRDPDVMKDLEQKFGGEEA